jgi:hypothetical protein
MFNCKNLRRFLLLCLFFFQIDNIYAQSGSKQSISVPIDTIVNYLERQYHVDLYYQEEWFRNKVFHSSVLDLPLNEITSILKNVCNCSFIPIDSTAIVFIPNDVTINNITINTTDYSTEIGNPREYGKYSRATINGKIVNGKTGEPLVGARIFVEKTKTGAVTDKNGNFKLTLAVGEYDIKLSYIGYEDNQTRIKLMGDGSATFEIMEKSILLNEVVITANRSDNNIIRTQMGMVQLNNKDVKELPLTLGETDIIKSATLLPGVQSVGEFGTGFNVRGGGADQNLILIENVPIFNSSHLFGLMSILNPEGISNVTLLKAGIPAKYGERVSSLMDIHMGSTNSDRIVAKAGIGLINSRLTVDIPLYKNKVNILIGGRTSYSDWLLHKIPDIDLMNSSARFYDLNSFITLSPNDKNKIFVFGYYSEDNFTYSHNTHYKYNNTLASIRWNHIINQKLSSSLMAGLSRYTYTVGEQDTLQRSEAYKIGSEVLYNDAKWNLTWHPNNNHSIDFGLNAVFYSINPGRLSPYDTLSLVVPVQMQKEKANEYAIYLSDDFVITPKLGAEIGVRYSLYTLMGPGYVYGYNDNSHISAENLVDTSYYKKGELIKYYSGLEPRISLRYSINDLSSVKFSFNRINQYINLVSNTSIMAPTDVWKLSDKYIKPLKCNQFSVGYFRNFRNNAIEASVELYYKTLTNIIEYKNGAQLLLNNHLETDLINAKGYNYGLEAYVKKNTGRLTGWASYTYSKSMQRSTGSNPLDQINGNNYFPSNYDRPHNVVINANYHISRRWRFSGSFLYSTGRPTTLPELQYKYEGYQLIYYSERNKYRLPDYNRLDISLTFDESLRLKKKWKGSWTLSIINVYGRKNAYSVFYQKDSATVENNYHEYSLYKLYIIGRPLPTLTYNLTF